MIGDYDWERTMKQELLLNICIETDLSKAAASDDIHDTLDYKALTDEIIAMAETAEFRLLEAFGKAVLEIISFYPKALAAEIEVEKPGALPFADAAVVVMNWIRSR